MYFDFKQSTAAARCVKCIVSKQENNAYLNFSRAKCQSMPARNRTAIFEWKFETERLLKIVSTLRKVLQSHYADKRVLRNYSACQRLCGKTSARDDASLKKFRFRVTEFPVINTVNCTSNIPASRTGSHGQWVWVHVRLQGLSEWRNISYLPIVYPCLGLYPCMVEELAQTALKENHVIHSWKPVRSHHYQPEGNWE